jgi:hypothetical protein
MVGSASLRDTPQTHTLVSGLRAGEGAQHFRLSLPYLPISAVLDFAVLDFLDSSAALCKILHVAENHSARPAKTKQQSHTGRPSQKSMDQFFHQ